MRFQDYYKRDSIIEIVNSHRYIAHQNVTLMQQPHKENVSILRSDKSKVYSPGEISPEVMFQYHLMILNHSKAIFDTREINLIVTIKQANGNISQASTFYTSKHARPIERRDRSFGESSWEINDLRGSNPSCGWRCNRPIFLAGLEAILPSIRSRRNTTSNNKNAIKELNEAPINTRQENGAGKKSRTRKKKDCTKRAEQREAEEGTVNLLCINSTGSYEDKLQRERYWGRTKKITRDNYAHKSEC